MDKPSDQASTPDSRIARGREVVRSIFGEDYLERLETPGLAASFPGEPPIALGNVFADFWGREGLTIQTRCLVTLAFLIALRATTEVKIIAGVALRNSCAERELREVVMQAIPYCGFPTAKHARLAVEEAISEARSTGAIVAGAASK